MGESGQQPSALLCLTSAKSVKCIWTAGLAPAQHPPASRLACTPNSLDPAPGRPAPLAGPAGQLASAAPGAKAGGRCPAGCPGMWGSPGRLLCLSVWPALCLPDLGPVCVCLSAPPSEFGAVCESVSCCLITWGLYRSVCVESGFSSQTHLSCTHSASREGLSMSIYRWGAGLCIPQTPFPAQLYSLQGNP